MILSSAAKLAEIIAAIGVVAGIILAYIGYEAETEARKERFTFEYASQYYSVPFQDSRDSIRVALRAIEKINISVDLDSKALGVLLRAYLKRDPNSDLELSIVSLADFYAGAKTCIDTDICDAEIMNSLLGTEADDLLCLLSPSIKYLSLKGGSDDAMAGLKYFSKTDDSC